MRNFQPQIVYFWKKIFRQAKIGGGASAPPALRPTTMPPTLVLINDVALRRVQVPLGRSTGKPSRYTNHPGRLSLPSIRGKKVRNRVSACLTGVKAGRIVYGQQVTLCDHIRRVTLGPCI